MNRILLGAALIAATGALAAETGCQSSEQKAAIKAAEEARSDLDSIRYGFRAALAGATKERVYVDDDGDDGDKFMFEARTTLGDRSLLRLGKSVVFCADGPALLNVPFGGGIVANLEGRAFCAHRVYKPTPLSTESPSGTPSFQLALQEGFSHREFVLGDGTTKETAKFHGYKNDDFFTSTEVDRSYGGRVGVDETRCEVNEVEVPANHCSQVIDAVGLALDEIFTAGKEAHERLAASKAAAAPSSAPDAGQSVHKGWIITPGSAHY